MTERADNFMAAVGRATGGEVYRVGGSVRDEVAGKRPKDADYMVRGVSLKRLGAAMADQGTAPSPLKLRDGRQAGWRLRDFGCIEVVLPRRDEPREAREGESVHRAFDIVVDPDVTVEQDSQRRDFTFNALYRIIHHPDNLRTLSVASNGETIEDVLDPTGRGVEDLLRKCVRTTHERSFEDDPLRTLRALRFVSTLGYELAKETMVQMVVFGGDVDGLAGKEMSGLVVSELTKIITGRNAAEALRIARDTGVLAALGLPHDDRPPYDDFRGFEMLARQEGERDVQVAWAHLFRRQTPQAWRKQAKRMHVGAKLREDIVYLLSQEPLRVTGKFRGSDVRRLRVKHGDDRLRRLIAMRGVSLHAMSQLKRPFQIRLMSIAEEQERARLAKVPAHTKDLLINGHDVMQLGVEGRDVGRVLNAVLDQVVQSGSWITCTRSEQMAMAKEAVGDGR